MLLSRDAALELKTGGGGGPGRGRGLLPLLRLREVVEAVAPVAGFGFRFGCWLRGRFVLLRGVALALVVVEGLVEAGFRVMLGRTRRFCLEGGRISSRSMGTPRETRKRRRMRERVQLGGWRGGGETSWCQRERERGERKGAGGVFEVEGGGLEGVLGSVGGGLGGWRKVM